MENSIAKKIGRYQYKRYKSVFGSGSKIKNIRIYEEKYDNVDLIAENYATIYQSRDGERVYFVDYILMNNDLLLLQQVIGVWFSNPEKKQIAWGFDVKTCVDLAFYLTMSAQKPKNIFSNDELNYIATLSPDQIHKLLGAKYKGPTDHASLLFALLTGYSAPPYTYVREREVKVSNYEPKLVYYLSNGKNLYARSMGAFKSVEYAPYIKIIMSSESDVEKIMLTVDENNVEYYTRYYGLSESLFDLDYFLNEIRDYTLVLSRPKNMQFYSDSQLEAMQDSDIFNYLRSLTTIEILEKHITSHFRYITTSWRKEQYKIPSHREEIIRSAVYNMKHPYWAACEEGLSYGTLYNNYCFDEQSLYENYRVDGSRVIIFDPTTKEPFDENTIKDLHKYLTESRVYPFLLELLDFYST